MSKAALLFLLDQADALQLLEVVYGLVVPEAHHGHRVLKREVDECAQKAIIGLA